MKEKQVKLSDPDRRARRTEGDMLSTLHIVNRYQCSLKVPGSLPSS